MDSQYRPPLGIHKQSKEAKMIDKIQTTMDKSRLKKPKQAVTKQHQTSCPVL